MARVAEAAVLLRVEDHDRSRARPAYDAALLEDLAWLGFDADEGPVRQSDDEGPYAAALEVLLANDLVYGCDCSRGTFATWSREHSREWRGLGCPGGCQGRGVPGPVLRVALGGGTERWMDALVGPCADDVAGSGDLPIRDRDGQWTYGFSVVVDDLRQDVDLIVRGRDLLHATAAQIRLGRILGREAEATFAHHPLIRRPDGRKLSKADADTSVRELRAAGRTAEELIGAAAAAVGLVESPRPIEARDVDGLFAR